MDMNTPVNFKIAKLLKEKEINISKFNCPWYNELGTLNGRTDLNKDGKTFLEVYPNEQSFCGSAIKPEHKKEFNIESYLAPTIAEVIMWLYDKHGIWVNVYLYKDHVADVNDDYMFRSNYTKIREYKTPTEAYEKAIKYVLTEIL